MKKWNLILALYTVISLITSIDAIAHQPQEIWLENAWINYRNAEKACRSVARNLNELDNIQRIAKSDWDDNNEDMRDRSIDAAGNLDLSITALFTDAANFGLDLHEKMSLSEILDAAISKTESTKQELLSLIRKRDSAHGILLYFIDIHDGSPT